MWFTSRSLRPPTTLPVPRWRYSLILPVALLAVLGTFAFTLTYHDNRVVAVQIVDDAGQPVSGATISYRERMIVADDQGVADITVDASDTSANLEIDVHSDGYQQCSATISPGEPQSRVQLTRTQSIATSASPPAAQVAQRATPTPDEPRELAVEGSVQDAAGKPIQGARITDGEHLDITGKDGLFSFKPGVIGPDAGLLVTASGYANRKVELTDRAAGLVVELEQFPIRAIYLNPGITTTDAQVDRLIEIIDTTEANAIVVDIKEELVFFDSQVPLFVDNDTVVPKYDLDALLEKLHDHDIYVIARLVVFKDSLIAERNPDLAVINNQTGEVWRDMNGVAWVNPMDHTLWEANTDLALEAAGRGFDEIQYDYIRFPTDGDLTTTDFGLERTQENRQAAIEGFLKMSRQKLLPTGANVSADIFGYTILVDDDLGIGQNLVRLKDYVDYLSPMVYPSHFPEGSLAVPGHPNDYPYETIEISMSLAREKLGGSAIQLRPWLQDFDYFDLMPYGDEEVRAQIDAANDVGTSGWMLWDPNNEYHPDALQPDEDNSRQSPPEAPAAIAPDRPLAIIRRRFTPARPRR